MTNIQMMTPQSPVSPGTIALTMWETTRISAIAVGQLNKARCVVVPCEANRRWFAGSGVTVPIRVVPLGIDPEIYHPGPRRPDPEVVRLGTAGRLAHGGVRKGLDEVIAAFLAAFPGDDGATLDVKCWPDCPLAPSLDPRIRLVRDVLTDGEMADWYRSLDCYASASKGEGWGMQPHEAMACQVPVIAAIWSGHAEYMDESCCYPLEWDERPAEGIDYVGLGNWCVPRHDSLVARMREAYADPEGRRCRGEAAAKRAAEFTWDRAAGELAAILREFGPAPAAKSPPENRPPTFDRARHDEINLLVLGCEYRGGPVQECGCTKTNFCLAGKGRPVPGTNLTDVTYRDCTACVTARTS